MMPQTNKISSAIGTNLQLFGAATALGLFSQRIQPLLQWFLPVNSTPPVRETSSEKIGKNPEPETKSSYLPKSVISFAVASVSVAAQQFWDSIPTSTKVAAGLLVSYWAWNRWNQKAKADVQVVENRNQITIHIHGGSPLKIKEKQEANGGKVVDVVLPPPCGCPEEA